MTKVENSTSRVRKFLLVTTRLKTYSSLLIIENTEFEMIIKTSMSFMHSNSKTITTRIDVVIAHSTTTTIIAITIIIITITTITMITLISNLKITLLVSTVFTKKENLQVS